MRDSIEDLPLEEATSATPGPEQRGMRLEVTLSSLRGSQPALIDNVGTARAGVSAAIGLAVNQSITLELLNGRSIAATVVSRTPGRYEVEFVQPLHGHDPLLKLVGKRN